MPDHKSFASIIKNKVLENKISDDNTTRLTEEDVKNAVKYYKNHSKDDKARWMNRFTQTEKEACFLLAAYLSSSKEKDFSEKIEKAGGFLRVLKELTKQNKKNHFDIEGTIDMLIQGKNGKNER